MVSEQFVFNIANYVIKYVIAIIIIFTAVMLNTLLMRNMINTCLCWYVSTYKLWSNCI